MKKYLPKSHKLLNRYMDGDKSISIQDIKKQEEVDEINYHINNIKYLKPIIKPVIYFYFKVIKKIFLT